MLSPDPRKVYADLRAQARAPATDSERSLYVLLHGAEALTKALPLNPWTSADTVDPSVEYPWDIYHVDAVRSVLEAFLISSDSNAAVGQAVSMAAEEVHNYRKLFFDTTKFRTDLELIAFLQRIPDANEAKKLYKIAFHQGLGALQWHFCRDKGDISPEVVIRTVMTDSYYRSLEHRGQPITSKVAKEAAKLARTAMDCAKTLLTEDPGSTDVEDLHIKFERVRKNRTVDDLNLTSTDEILH